MLQLFLLLAMTLDYRRMNLSIKKAQARAVIVLPLVLFLFLISFLWAYLFRPLSLYSETLIHKWLDGCISACERLLMNRRLQSCPDSASERR